jgi:aspartyl aminopeptidase
MPLFFKVGCPQLAMHSIRELADANSIVQAIALFTVVYFDPFIFFPF